MSDQVTAHHILWGLHFRLSSSFRLRPVRLRSAPSSYSLQICSSVACLSVCFPGLLQHNWLQSLVISQPYTRAVSHLITAPKSPISRSSIQCCFGGIWPERKCNLRNHSLGKVLSITTDSCYPFIHPGRETALNWLSTVIQAL